MVFIVKVVMKTYYSQKYLMMLSVLGNEFVAFNVLSVLFSCSVKESFGNLKNFHSQPS